MKRHGSITCMKASQMVAKVSMAKEERTVAL